MTQNNDSAASPNDHSLEIKRPDTPGQEPRGPGSGPAARNAGSTTNKKPIMVSKTYSLPEKLSIQLKIASALTNREQGEIMAEALEPYVQDILRQNAELMKVP